MSPALRASFIAMVLLATFVLAVTLGACGGGEDEPSSTPLTSSPTTATESPSAETGTPEPSLPPLTLEASISPESVARGETATVTFTTEPRAIIGFQVVDAAGETIVQSTVTAGADGTAVYEIMAAEPPGTWTVSAGAGRTIIELLIMQANPVPGPNTADVTFEVR